MNKISPQIAALLTKTANSDQMKRILNKIQREACFGGNYCIIGSHLDKDIILILKERGWDVRIEDGINNTIHW